MMLSQRNPGRVPAAAWPLLCLSDRGTSRSTTALAGLPAPLKPATQVQQQYIWSIEHDSGQQPVTSVAQYCGLVAYLQAGRCLFCRLQFTLQSCNLHLRSAQLRFNLMHQLIDDGHQTMRESTSFCFSDTSAALSLHWRRSSRFFRSRAVVRSRRRAARAHTCI